MIHCKAVVDEQQFIFSSHGYLGCDDDVEGGRAVSLFWLWVSGRLQIRGAFHRKALAPYYFDSGP